MSLKNGLAVWLLIVTLSCGLPDRGAAEPMNWPCSGRCFDAAWISNKGWAYFVKGDQFWLYDIVANRIDHGHPNDAVLKLRDFVYPKPMRWPGLPQSWSKINAALNGGDGKVYWFKGHEYVRFDIASEKVDAGPQPIAKQWPALPLAWSSGFDAAVNWGNGRIIFFKGREALSYDLAGNNASQPRPIAEVLRGIPVAWSDGIDTIVNWGNGKAYIFKREEYLRYDIATDKADSGPQPIASNWPGLIRFVDWVSASSKLPNNALIVGHAADNRPLFLCAAVVGTAIYPGKTWSADQPCIYSDGQSELRAGVNAYAIATTTLSIAWMPAASTPRDKLIPVGAAAGGRTLYLCRAPFAKGIHPGRIDDATGGCTVSHGGRSHTVKDNVEFASAPTIVNSPYIPLLVRMLSPLPGSERFKDVCFAEINPTFSGRALQGEYPRDLPDVKTVFRTVARNVCLMLYKNPGQAPKYARKLELIVMDPPPGQSGLGNASRHAHCTMRFDPRWLFPAESVPLPDVLITFYHETAHCMQHVNGSGPLLGAFHEGHADYIRWVKVWGSRVTDAGGNFKDGYKSVAYFLEWLDRRHPEFVYKFNMALSAGSKSIDEIIHQLTGKPRETLWQEYQNFLTTSLAWPESQLRWSLAKTPETARNPAAPAPPAGPARTFNGIRVVSGTYGGNCQGRLTGGAGGTPDKTPHLKAECEGKGVCEYSVVWQKIGDPASGCRKDYVAVWQCPGGGGGTARAEPEAGNGSKVILSCNR